VSLNYTLTGMTQACGGVFGLKNTSISFMFCPPWVFWWCEKIDGAPRLYRAWYIISYIHWNGPTSYSIRGLGNNPIDHI